MDKAHELAKVLWDYHNLNQPISQSDCIIALGNSDTRTAERAAELFNDGFGKLLVCTGGFGRLTKDNFKKSEAAIFADIAKKLGVPEDKIIIEDQATNTFDNLRFTKKLLANRGVEAQSFLLVTKPYMERRAYAAFSAVWKDAFVKVTSPSISFEDYTNNVIPVELLINMLVGDHQRLIIFSKSGHIPEQVFPEDVTQAYKTLIKLGYTTQLIPEENIDNLLAAVSAGNA